MDGEGKEKKVKTHPAEDKLTELIDFSPNVITRTFNVYQFQYWIPGLMFEHSKLTRISLEGISWYKECNW